MLKANKTPQGHYVCPVCDKTELKRTTMFYHMKKHTGELNYVCPIDGCGRAFLQKSAVDQHVSQVHATAPPSLVCPACPKAFRTKSNLHIHICRMHGKGWMEDPVTTKGVATCHCAHCNKQFASTAAYYYHAYGCFDVPATLKG